MYIPNKKIVFRVVNNSSIGQKVILFSGEKLPGGIKVDGYKYETKESGEMMSYNELIKKTFPNLKTGYIVSAIKKQVLDGHIKSAFGALHLFYPEINGKQIDPIDLINGINPMQFQSNVSHMDGLKLLLVANMSIIFYIPANTSILFIFYVEEKIKATDEIDLLQQFDNYIIPFSPQQYEFKMLNEKVDKLFALVETMNKRL